MPQEKKQSINAQDAFFENIRLMKMIVQSMKEIPELPSEQPKDNFPLTKVEFPEEGGVLTYMEGQEEPYRGFPYYEFVDKIDVIKKITRTALSGFYHQTLKRNKLKLLPLLLNAWLFKDLVRIGIYVFYRMIERFRIKSERYSKSVRELYRAFGENNNEFKKQIRDLTCMLLEFDNAYRFRFQDLIEELNKENLKKNPLKELERLLEIAQEREKTQELKDTWTLFKKVFLLYLKYDKELRKILVGVFLEINQEEAKLTKEDKHYCKPRQDYLFGFMK